VRVVRLGRQWSVHLAAFLHYRRKLAARFDVVVDEVNTIPFFTPLWAEIPIVMLIHQLAREVWWYETVFPLSAAGFVAEPLYLRLYRRVPVLTVSASTRADLEQLGFSGPIAVVPEGIEPIAQLIVNKATVPRFLYVGRLARSKRISDVIRAFAIFCQTVEPSELHIVGDGPSRYVRELHNVARSLGVANRVDFMGKLAMSSKHHEMATAHVLLLTSVREGWGLVITEANALGTPAVAYDVPGLRDSIRDRETGLLVEPTPEALARGMTELWRDHSLYDRLRLSGRSFSNALSFDATATACRAALTASIDYTKLQSHDGATAGS